MSVSSSPRSSRGGEQRSSTSGTAMSRMRSSSGLTTVLAAFAGTALVAGVVAAGVAMPTVGAMSALAKTAIDSFESYPSDLADPILPQRSRITDAKGKTLAYLWDQNRVNVTLSEVATPMQEAMVAIEDSRFYEHNGIDVRGTLRALRSNQESGGVQQGGSTITQQLVKMILLNNAKTKQQAEDATKRSYDRKLREARYAIALEKRKTKAEIMIGYLNIAYFGAGAYGVQTAAQTYFGKDADRLNLVESATLAGIVNQPGAFDPIRNPAASQVRRNAVLRRMQELGYITSSQYAHASKVKIKTYMHPHILKNGCPTSKSPYFCDYVLNYIRNEPAFGRTRKERIAMLKNGGLTIRTTLNQQAQNSAQNSAEGHIPVGDGSRKGAAISMVQPGTGKVIAMAQNTRWGTKGLGRTSYNYNVRKAEGGTIGFQSGSSFKPFTLAAALEKGISPYVAISAPAVRTFYGFRDCDGYGFPPYTVKGGGGVENMYSGTKGSINTFFVGLEQMVSLCRQAEIAESMGVRKGNGERLNRVPSFVLGANEVVPLDMAGAFATFANDGVWCKPNPVTDITTNRGKRIYRFQPQCRRVLSSRVADTVVSLLHGPVTAGGTFPGAQFGRDIAGKTGTTDSSSAVWFVGFTPQISTAVWVGDPRGGYRYPMRNVYVNGSYYYEVFGATIPGPIWRSAMIGAHEGLPYKSFGGGPKYLNLDLSGNAKLPKKNGGAAGTPPAQTTPQPQPEPAPSPTTDDYGLDLLDNLPEFHFG